MQRPPGMRRTNSGLYSGLMVMGAGVALIIGGNTFLGAGFAAMGGGFLVDSLPVERSKKRLTRNLSIALFVVALILFGAALVTRIGG